MSHVSSSLGLVGLGSILLSTTSVAWALGIGGITNNTVLGARLDVSIAVLGSADEKSPPPPDCIKPVVEAGEAQLNPRQLRAILHPGSGEALYMVQVVSDVSINEPVVSVSLSLGCFSPLTKRFVLFVDPPGFSTGSLALQSAAAGSAASASVREAQADSAPLTSSPGLVAGAAGRRIPSSGSRADITLSTERKRAPSARPATGQSPKPAKSSPRLSLEAPNIAAVPPSIPASDPAEDEGIANQMALLAQLENMLKQISTENHNVRAGMATLKAKLMAAELELQGLHSRQREQPPIVWVLSGVIGVMSLGLFALWLRQRRQPRSQSQFASVFGAQQAADLPDSSLLNSMPAPMGPVEPTLTDQLRNAAPRGKSEPAGAVARALVVDDMVDLDQQADFFIALGNDQAAIDLLSSQAAQGSSPLPYLKLIDIHRRRGERMAYEQLRLRFHRRFNARIPDWAAEAAAGRGLEDYPEVQTRLEASWAEPVSALTLLEGLLFRLDGQGVTFDLSAFRDLLMLHAVVKDLLAQGNAHAVDLELPLGGA